MPHDGDPQDLCMITRVVAVGTSSPVEGHLVWDPPRSLWATAMIVTTLVFGAQTLSWGAVVTFMVLSALTVMMGYSVGYHRLLIHCSFECPLWLERLLVWIGTLTGISGPFWMVRTHDLRDWAQRQSDCHDYLAHRQGLWADALWQIHGRLVLDHPPRFDLGRIGRDPFYRFLDRTWMLHQLPLAILLWALGGWGFVVWGICARISVAITGQWFIGRMTHRQGPQSWQVKEAGVQGHDLPWAAVLTMGEAWHNNHHAYPASARIGLYPGQSDWGFRFIQGLERLGLAWNVQTPLTMTERHAALQDLKS